MRRIALILLIFFLFHFKLSFAQLHQIQFQHLTVSDGLSNNGAWAFTQDKFGFIWIGTTDGLNRYDGYEVDVFHHEANNPKSLPDDFILSLFTDSKGTIWVGTITGFARFDYLTQSFKTFKHEEGNSNSLPSNYIVKITEDKKGFLWIGTSQGLCRYDESKNQFQTFTPSANKNSISGKNVFDIANDKDGNLWITTNNGLDFLNTTTLQFTSWVHHDDPNSLSSNDLRYLSVDHKGKIWLGTQNNVIEHFDPLTGNCHHYSSFESKSIGYASAYLNQILTDQSGRVWIVSGTHGACYWIPDRDTFQFFQNDPLIPSSLSSSRIRSIYQDLTGMIWFGTGAGADRFNPSVTKFEIYQPTEISPTLPSKWVRAFCEDDQNRLWIATVEGVAVLNRDDGTYKVYQNDPNNSNSISDNSVRSLCRDRYGTIWVGTASGLCRYNPEQNNFRRYHSLVSKTSLPGSFIYMIIIDHNNNLLIATSGGLCRYNYATDDFTPIPADSSFGLQMRAIYEDAQHNLWIGLNNENKLIRYNPSSDKVNSWRNDPADSNSIARGGIWSITQDKSGVIWVGTETGLCSYNALKNIFVSYTRRNGLPSNRVSDLLVDAKNNLWIGTDRGLCEFDALRKHFQRFDETDGLQGMQFETEPPFVTHDGYFCFGGHNGFNMFRPDSFHFNRYKPPVVIHSFKIFDKKINLDSMMTRKSSLHLSYNQNFFSFELAALNYDYPEKNQYEYQLVGFDKKMIRTKNRLITYTNVPPGEYTLKVRASNNDGIWNESGITLPLFISPPFWKTWWFYLLGLIAISSALYGLYRLRINRLLAVQRVRNLISRDLHDDVGSTLSSIRMMSALAKRKLPEDQQKTDELLEKINDTSTRMTETLQDIVWAVNADNDNFERILMRMHDFAAQAFEAKNIELKFSADESIKSLKLPLHHRRDFFLIYKEAVNNLSKYSEATHGNISLSKNHRGIRMEISDDGNGFNADSNLAGNGIRNMRERAKHLNGNLTIESEVGKGTKVILEMKI